MTIPSGGHILVVDDDADSRRILDEYLSWTGYEVWTAENAEKALRLMRERCPAAVVVDVRMPRMSGVELVRIVRADAELRRVPVVAVSAYADSDPDLERELEEAGADACVAKPPALQELVHTLGALIARGAA